MKEKIIGDMINQMLIKIEDSYFDDSNVLDDIVEELEFIKQILEDDCYE